MNATQATASRTARPVALVVIPENIPQKLKDLRQWVMFRYEWKEGHWKAERWIEGRWNKTPYIARASYRAKASIDKPLTWDCFGAAITIYQEVGGYDGIMFALCEADPFMGIDLDHSLNPSTGEVEDWARAIIARMPGYWEISPSGTGLRHIRRGKLPEDGRRNGGRRKGDIEMYDCGRFLSITGHILKGDGHACR